MFGTHPLFGDYVDAIHGNGGILSRVVRNIAEPPRPPGERFEDRLDRYHRWLDGQGLGSHRVEVVHLDDYLPAGGERPLIGFWGPKALPLADYLARRFGHRFPPLVHPSAYASPMSTLEEGAFLAKGAVIGSNATIGRFSYVNTRASVGHDCVLGDGVIIGPQAAIASGVHFETGVIVGIGATVIEGLTIGEGSYIGAGAVVLKDVPPGVLVAGVPAAVKKTFSRKPLLVEPDPSGQDRYLVIPPGSAPS